ncbi:hypothetical protein ACQ4WX_03405 [Streptomyces lasalocidi]
MVGWSLDSSPTAPMPTDALGMAIGSRRPRPGGTIIHSGHGVQFSSWSLAERTRATGLLPSVEDVAVDRPLQPGTDVAGTRAPGWRPRLSAPARSREQSEGAPG